MEKLLYTPIEAARTLGIGRSKLYELIGSGQLASVRIGACRRIPAPALAEFLFKLTGRQTRATTQDARRAVRGSDHTSHRPDLRAQTETLRLKSPVDDYLVIGACQAVHSPCAFTLVRMLQ